MEISVTGLFSAGQIRMIDAWLYDIRFGQAVKILVNLGFVPDGVTKAQLLGYSLDEETTPGTTVTGHRKNFISLRREDLEIEFEIHERSDDDDPGSERIEAVQMVLTWTQASVPFHKNNARVELVLSQFFELPDELDLHWVPNEGIDDRGCFDVRGTDVDMKLYLWPSSLPPQ
ncbi:MAG: hypothetical protein KDD53_01305 [Bdellovibrionales bacterium]|nr:hypothetical protein [Bdellovibrionales bacterium]